MAVRRVVYLGHPALRAPNRRVSDFSSPEIKKLITNLIDTMYDTELVGIAAPQIGENYLVFVTHARTTSARKLGKKDMCRVFINPKITSFSNEKSIIYEGCGSVISGSLFGPVLRPKRITVEAFNEKGKKFSLTCDGLLARIIQHEYDHLLGVEFIQKVDNYAKLLSKEFYQKTIRNSKKQREASRITKIECRKILNSKH